MQITIPCDWTTVDLLKEQDPNRFGEAMLDGFFVGNCEDVGCYSSFKVIETLNKVESGIIYEEVKKEITWKHAIPTVYHQKLEEKDCYIQYEDCNNPKGMKICDPYEIVCGWAWDGDGSLYFRFNDRKVVNSDCKNDYEWKWV